MSERPVSTYRLRSIPGLGRNTAIGLAVAVGIIGFAIWRGVAAGSMGDLGAATFKAHLPDLSPLAAAPVAVKIHLVGALTALGIGTALLIGVKGSAVHRTLGWIWVAAMAQAAISSFFIHSLNPNGLSFIHALSGWTIISLPMAVFAIRRRKVVRHARIMTGMYVGGLILAGALSFLPGRLMWQLVFG